MTKQTETTTDPNVTEEMIAYAGVLQLQIAGVNETMETLARLGVRVDITPTTNTAADGTEIRQVLMKCVVVIAQSLNPTRIAARKLIEKRNGNKGGNHA